MGHPHNELHNIFIDKKENTYVFNAGHSYLSAKSGTRLSNKCAWGQKSHFQPSTFLLNLNLETI